MVIEEIFKKLRGKYLFLKGEEVRRKEGGVGERGREKSERERGREKRVFI